MVQAWLAQVLGQRRPKAKEQGSVAEPPVAILLQIDRQYRDKAKGGELPKIAPKRFNPKEEAWLSIMHKTSGEWHTNRKTRGARAGTCMPGLLFS